MSISLSVPLSVPLALTLLAIANCKLRSPFAHKSWRNITQPNRKLLLRLSIYAPNRHKTIFNLALIPFHSTSPSLSLYLYARPLLHPSLYKINYKSNSFGDSLFCLVVNKARKQNGAEKQRQQIQIHLYIYAVDLHNLLLIALISYSNLRENREKHRD